MTETPRPRIFLDLDGTLSDAGPAITASIRHACAALDRPLADDADLSWCVGPPLQDSFKTLMDGDGARADEALALYRAHYTAGGMLDAPLYPGIAEALAALRLRGWRMFLATSKPHLYARDITAHLGVAPYLEQTFGAELDGTRGTKADLLAHALAATGSGPAVMIGDRRHDIEGARANGIRSVGVLWGYGSRDELVAAGADRLADAPGALAETIAACLD